MRGRGRGGRHQLGRQVSCDWLLWGHVTACSPLIGPGRFAAWATDLGVTVFDTGAAMKKEDMYLIIT